MSIFNNITKGVTSAVTSGITGIKYAADTASAFAAQSKIAQEYQILELTATSGCKGRWKIYKAQTKKQGTVWILEKKDLDEGYKRSKVCALKSYADILAAETQWLVRLKHPGIIKILEPLEEIRTQYSMVTEEVSCSVHNWLRNWDPITSQVRPAMRELPLSELELKNGLNHVLDTMSFLHSKGIAHCNLSPENVLITAEGGWKLTGFGFAQTITTNPSAEAWGSVPFQEGQATPTYPYDALHPPLGEVLAKPVLQYTAPELIHDSSRPAQRPLSMACDVFSLGCITYEVLTRQPMLTALNATEYRGFFASIHLLPMDKVPFGLQAMLKQMISENPLSRPPATAVATAPYFADDMLLRALRFVENMLSRDLTQKQAFMRDMPSFMRRFDARITRLRILPVLLDECRNEAMRGCVIPIVLQLLEGQTPQEFQDHVLPHMRLVMQVAHGAQLVEIIEMLPRLQELMRVDQVEDVIVPMLMGALERGDSSLQEEVMKALPPVLDKIGTHCLTDKVLLRLHNVALRTSSAVVRAGALRNLARVAPRLTAHDSDQLLKMITQITAVDKSAPTLMSSLLVAEAISQSRQPHYLATSVLPVLVPLLVCDSLSVKQFHRFYAVVKDLLRAIEAKVAGGTVERPSASDRPVNWDEGAAAVGPSWTPPPAAAAPAGSALDGWETPSAGAAAAAAAAAATPGGGYGAAAAAGRGGSAMSSGPSWGSTGGPPMSANSARPPSTAGAAGVKSGSGDASRVSAGWSGSSGAYAAAAADPFSALSVGGAAPTMAASRASNSAGSFGAFSGPQNPARTAPAVSSDPFVMTSGPALTPPITAPNDPFASFAMSAPAARPAATTRPAVAAPSPSDWFSAPSAAPANGDGLMSMGLMSGGAMGAPMVPDSHQPSAPDPFTNLFDAALAASPRQAPAKANAGADPFASLAGGSFF